MNNITVWFLYDLKISPAWEWVTISGIVWVDKRYLWLFYGCLEYHRPIITNACPSKRSQISLQPELVSILPRFPKWKITQISLSVTSYSPSSNNCKMSGPNWGTWRNTIKVEINLPVKRNPEYSLKALWVLHMTSNAGWVTCPVWGSCCQGDAKSCARSFSMSVPRSEMILITGAALRLRSERKMAFLRYSACWLCKSSKLVTYE